MKSIYSIVYLALFSGFVAGCWDRNTPSRSSTNGTGVDTPVAAAKEHPAGWGPTAIATIERLVERLREANIPCDDFEISVFDMLAGDYAKRFREIPAAEGSCTSLDDEDLTFYVFDDTKKLTRFLSAKQAILCHGAREFKMDYFPGFPYVKGDTWFVQPDERETAEHLAAILGGEAGVADCASMKYQPSTAPTSPGELTIEEPTTAADDPVVVVFAEADPNFGLAPLEVQFSISDPMHHLVAPSITWDFGDGQSSSERSPKHTYTQPGTYVAKLKIIQQGVEDEDEVEVTVEAPVATTD